MISKIVPPGILVFCLLSRITAQEIVTDRPDFTESALAVPYRVIQIESGVGYISSRNIETFSYPNILGRIGLGGNLEVRLGFPGLITVVDDPEMKTYFNDIHLEAKYQITGDDAEFPLAILLVSTVPVGADEVSVGLAQLGAKIAGSCELNEYLGLGFNVGAVSINVGQGREILSLASVSFGAMLTDRLGAYLEFYTFVPEDITWQPVIDGGLTYLLTPAAQLDLYLGKGLNAFAEDLVIGTGFSFRFDY